MLMGPVDGLERETEKMGPLETLRHHVTGAIERGEAQAITEERVPTLGFRRIDRRDPSEPWMCAFGCLTEIRPVIGSDGYVVWRNVASGVRHYDECAPWRAAVDAAVPQYVPGVVIS